MPALEISEYKINLSEPNTDLTQLVTKAWISDMLAYAKFRNKFLEIWDGTATGANGTDRYGRTDAGYFSLFTQNYPTDGENEYTRSFEMAKVIGFVKAMQAEVGDKETNNITVLEYFNLRNRFRSKTKINDIYLYFKPLVFGVDGGFGSITLYEPYDLRDTSASDRTYAISKLSTLLDTYGNKFRINDGVIYVNDVDIKTLGDPLAENVFDWLVTQYFAFALDGTPIYLGDQVIGYKKDSLASNREFILEDHAIDVEEWLFDKAYETYAYRKGGQYLVGTSYGNYYIATSLMVGRWTYTAPFGDIVGDKLDIDLNTLSPNEFKYAVKYLMQQRVEAKKGTYVEQFLDKYLFIIIVFINVATLGMGTPLQAAFAATGFFSTMGQLVFNALNDIKPDEPLDETAQRVLRDEEKKEDRFELWMPEDDLKNFMKIS